MNNIFCNRIRFCRLRTENNRNRSIRNISGLNLKIFVNDIQCVHLLALVLMQALYLNIKDGLRIDFYTAFFLHICSKTFLIFRLNFKHACNHIFIICIFYKLRKFPCFLFKI